MRLETFVLLIAVLNFIIVLEFVRRRKLTESFALIWAGVALGGFVLVVARPAIDAFSEWVGVEAGTSVVFALAILFLLIVSIYLSVHITRSEERIERLAEEVALLRGIQTPVSIDDDDDSGTSADGAAAP
jgi:hypothetical protein